MSRGSRGSSNFALSRGLKDSGLLSWYKRLKNRQNLQVILIKHIDCIRDIVDYYDRVAQNSQMYNGV
jgi:hypothetical protein